MTASIFKQSLQAYLDNYLDKDGLPFMDKGYCLNSTNIKKKVARGVYLKGSTF